MKRYCYFIMSILIILILFPLSSMGQMKLVLESSTGDRISTPGIKSFSMGTDNTMIIYLDQPFTFASLYPDISVDGTAGSYSGCTVTPPASVTATQGSNISFKLISDTSNVTFSMVISPEPGVANFNPSTKTFTWNTGGSSPVDKGSYLAVFQAEAGSASSQLVVMINIVSENPTYYTLNVTANPTNGGSVTGSGSYLAGNYATVTATPYTNYTFSSWTGDVSNPSSATTTVLMNGNKTVTANFTYTGGGGGGGTGDGTKENPIPLNNPIYVDPNFVGSMWGYKYLLTAEYTIPKGKTVYFLVDPYAIIGSEITYTLRFNVFNYNQTTNVSSKLITINKSTGAESSSDFSGAQAYKDRKLLPISNYKYLIMCTETGLRDQKMSIWWEIRSY